MGKGPGTDMHLLTIHWIAGTGGGTDVEIIINSLVDPNYNDIGTPAGRTGTIEIYLE